MSDGDMAIDIPIVELGSLFRQCEPTPSAQVLARRKLIQAFEKYGVAYIRLDEYEEGIVEKIVTDALKATEQLFGISDEEKRKAVYEKNRPGITRGFIARGAESGQKGITEQKEAFSYSFDWTGAKERPGNGLEEYNVWPDCEEGSRRCLEAYLVFVGQVMETVSKLMVGSANSQHGMNIEEGMKISLMRCFHYFPCEAKKSDHSDTDMGSVPHTDWTYATLIAQKEPALQIKHEGRWRLVAPVANTLVINCGDFLALLSAGRMRSPLHRVILARRHRYSLVYFQYPPFHTPVPDIGEAKDVAPKENIYLRGLSLFADQSEENDSGNGIHGGECFGELIMKKWTQVQRKKK